MILSKLCRILPALLTVLYVLSIGAEAAPTPTNRFFAPLPALDKSIYEGNIAFTTWLIEGVDRIRAALLKQTDLTQTSPAGLELLRSTVRADAAYLGSPSGPARELARFETQATEQISALESIVLNAPDPASRRIAEQNLSALRKQADLAATARQQLVVYAHRLDDLASTLDGWLTFWSVTQSARGPDQTRKQVAELIGKELERWDALRMQEIAENLLARNLQVPTGLPGSLRSAFEKIAGQMPRFAGDPRLTPDILRPLLEPEATNGISILLKTTHPANVRLLVTDSDGQTVSLDSTADGPLGYRAIWHPKFLSDTGWHRRAQKTGRAELGAWRFTIELRSNPAETGAALLTSSTSFSLHAKADAPQGLALIPQPGKPKFLRQYPREDDIPLEQKHNILSILTYPVLGFPRDLVDAVFGAVDKVPYLSMPISLVYAGPGQLICKPWWDDAYRPFTQQSAGFYAWTGNDQDDWQYFENARTWFKTQSDDAAFLAFFLYLGLGFPRDVADVPFGILDQVPVISTPISHLYAPLTVVTKPWYAPHYNRGAMKDQDRVPYCQQSRVVICPEDWSQQSRWVFFENFKTTTFRSPDTAEQDHRIQRHRKELAAYQSALQAAEARNAEIKDSCVISLTREEEERAADDHVTR